MDLSSRLWQFMFGFLACQLKESLEEASEKKEKSGILGKIKDSCG
jgi:hypothetical protein